MNEEKKTEAVAVEPPKEAPPQEASTEIATLDKDSMPALLDQAKEMGMDVQAEVDAQGTGQLPQPFLKINHDEKEGDHGFYVQMPEGIFGDTPIVWPSGNKATQVSKILIQVAMHEPNKAYFEDPSAKMPRCASANGKVLSFIEEPYNDGKPTCDGCPLDRFGSDCKPKIRVLVGYRFKLNEEDGEQIYPLIMHIPPTSLSNWNKLIKRCNVTKLPVQLFALELDLEDHQTANHRFARIKFDIKRALIADEIEFYKKLVSMCGAAFKSQHKTEFEKDDRSEEVPF